MLLKNTPPQRVGIVLTLVGLFVIGSTVLILGRRSHHAVPAPDSEASQSKSKTEIKEAYGRLPMSFEINRGQTDQTVKYLARGSGYSVFLTNDEAVLSLRRASQSGAPVDEDDSSRNHNRPSFSSAASAQTVLRMKLVGANPSARVSGEDELAGKSNYFIGADPAKWQRAVSNFARVKYQQVYPGIDLVYYGNQHQLEYDFVIQPGSDPKLIALGFAGADLISIGDAGELILSVSGQEVRQQAPKVYQEVNGARNPITSRYALTAANQVSFELGAYDRTKPLVIDPVLVYSTYFGGTGADTANAITVNGAGEAFITGTTASANFPGTSLLGASTANGDAYVAKVNATGTAIVFASYFGGDNPDLANAIALDQSGNIYVAGSTQSFNFPTAGTPYQATKKGGPQMKKSADGGANYSTITTGLASANINGVAISPSDPNTAFVTSFGGEGLYKTTDGGAHWVSSRGNIPDASNNAVAIDPTNPAKVYVAACNPGGVYRSNDGGATWSATSVIGTCMNTVITDATGSVYAGGFDGQGLHKSTDGGVTWTTIPIGTAFDSVDGLALAPSSPGMIYAGTSNGVYKSTDFGQTWTITALNTGSNFDDSIAVDPANSQIVFTVVDFQLKKTTDGGATWALVTNLGIAANGFATAIMFAPTLPTSTVYVGTTTNGIVQSSDNGATWSPANLSNDDVSMMAYAPSSISTIYVGNLSGSDAFVTKLDPTGSSLVYSTYLGGGTAADKGDKDDGINAIVVDPSGNAFVGGVADTVDFPSVNSLGAFGGQADAIVAKLDPNGSSLLFSTTLGGPAIDICNSLALSASGDLYLTGQTLGSFPTVNPSQPANAGNRDVFVARLIPSGNTFTLGYSTYLGGANNDIAFGIAVDGSGNAYVTGQTGSINFPVLNAMQSTRAGSSGSDAFLTKFNSSGGRVYSTYLGGTGTDIARGVAVDAAGNAYVAGLTSSSNFPVTNQVQSFGGGFDAFVTKVNPAGSARIYSTYLGGGGTDQAMGIALDANNAVYIAGTTSSTEIKPGAIQTGNGGASDAFITKLAASSGPSATDLSVTLLDDIDPIAVNNNLTYSANVTNNGEADVTGVTLTTILPANTTFVSASASCSGTTTVTCNLAGMISGQSKSITIVVKPTAEGLITATASVAAAQSESNTANNSATQDTRVTIGTVYTVNSTADTDDGSCAAVGTGNGCTLREALIAANAHAGKDTIVFNIAGAGTKTISPSSTFPFVSDAVFIDGSSQPGFTGQPIIELNGSAAGQSNGLYITGGNTHVRGLAINGYFYGAINLKGGNNIIEGNYIGTNPAGNTAVPNNTGVAVESGANDLIGGTTLSARNVISGNKSEGVSISAGATGVQVQGNYIGLKADGSAALGQPNFTPGVALHSAVGNTIGGTAPGAGNVISGNNGPGIFLSNTFPGGTPGSSNNVIAGNLIGTTPNGLNALINVGSGITIGSGSSNNLIGGTSASARNVIANSLNLDTNSNGNTIQGNYIGIKADGSARIISTGWAGIQIRGSSNNTIGGSAAGAGNVISGNAGPGIWIVDTCTECNPSQAFIASNNTVVQGNFIGLNPTGTAAIPNTNNGIGIERGSTGSIIGGTAPGARNVISGNTGSGINISNFEVAANGTTIQGNYIGTNAAGTAAIGNNGNGINVNGVNNTIIGGSASGAGNLVSGNLSSGIIIGGGSPGGAQPIVGSTGTQVLGNFIGTNVSGSAVVRNTFSGISINGGSSNNHIGGTIAGARNLISGNGGNGVDINIGSNGNFVEGNYVGTDVTGMSAVVTTVNGAPFYGNGSGVGIVGSSNNKIGGTTAAERNVISGNNCQGVPINNGLQNNVVVQASTNSIQGNYIGLNKDGAALVTDPNGGAPFGNKCSGVFIAGATNNLIGGTAPGAGNVIGGSAHQGVVVSNGNGVSGSGNLIQGNIIGSNVAMTASLPNPIGVFLISGASNNLVGGDDAADGVVDGVVNAGNKIFASTGDGINIQTGLVNGTVAIATGNVVQGNLIGGSTLLRNGGNGVNLNGATNSIVGGTTAGAGNTISFNSNNGVVVNCPVLNGVATCGVGNAIQRNSIFSNSNIGIRLNGNGVSTGNNNQASPVVSFVSTNGANTSAQGSLASIANSQFTLEFFANDSCDPTGAGEGQTYLGSTQVTTDGSGNASFSVNTLNSVSVGKMITATATQATNGTSRFSSCVIAAPATATISGRATDQAGAPYSGATITLSGGQSATATTDPQGNYSFPNLPSNVSYTVGATLSGVTFYPASFTLANLPTDRTVNFTKALARYTITDLGALTAGPQSNGWDVNNSGQATGWSNSGPPNNTNFKPYFYNNGAITNLTPFGTGTSALAIAINESGRVVGYSELTPNGALHGFFSDSGGVLKDIGTFGGASSQAWGVNDNGVVVGQAQIASNQSRPFVWRDVNNDGVCQQSEMIDAGWINGGVNGRLFAINNNNVAVGNNIDGSTGFQTATLWKDDNANNVGDPGELRLLGTLGGPTSFAEGINDNGYVSGFSDIAGLASNGRQMQRAFIWHDDNGNGISDPGEMKNLGTLGGEFSNALRINASNEIVGWSDAVGINTAHAIRYKNNFMLDLNSAIPVNSGWVLTEARGISDNGKITGVGTIGGLQHAYLLTPSLVSQTVTLDAIANKTYGNAPFTVHATASSNLPVTYSFTGPATINGSTVTITGAGSVTITADQAGDTTYDTASASQTIDVAKKALSVTAEGKTRLFGAPDPSFTATYFGFVNGDTAASLGGTLSFTTNASPSSNVGNYSITPGGLASNNYSFNYLAGTLTIDQASTSTSSANYNLAVPGSVNLAAQVSADAPSTQSVNGGTVTFLVRQGAATVGSVTSGPVSNGQAAASFSVPAGGAYTIYVTYSGTSNHLGSTGLSSLTVGNANPVPSITGVTPDSAVKKPTETGQFTLLIDGNGFMSTANGNPANSSVDWYDRTTGQHTTLAITSTTAAQIQAVVPFTLIRDGKTVEVSVINPGPGGGASNVQPFFITDTTATVTAADTVLPDPVTGTASSTSVSSSGAVLSAAAASGGAAGSGTLTVAQYSEDPIGTNASPNTSAFSTANGGGYFDVYVAPGSSFTTLSLDYCNTGGTTLYWWNGSVWALVSNQTYNPSTGCITISVTTTSSPSIAQLTGTVFGVASGPSISSIAVTPSSTVALGSGPVTINASITDAGGTGPYAAEITWGDGQTTMMNVTGSTLTSTHAYSAANTYAIAVKVSRGSSFGTSTFSPLVVFDPNAGSMNSDGWFNAPLGSYPANPGFAGKIHFESQVAYEKTTNLLKGSLKVNLPTNDFKATSFAWLTINGSKLQLSGVGTLGNASGYAFLLTGIDGKLDGKKLPDKARVKIWEQATGRIIYDSQMGSADSALPTLVLGGGNVNIKK